MEMLQYELHESTQQAPSELLHLLSTQIAPPTGILLQPKTTEIDTLILHQNALPSLQTAQEAACWSAHLPYIKKIVFEGAEKAKFEERLTRKFLVDDRLFFKGILEKVGLVHTLENYEKKIKEDADHKSYGKNMSIDLLSLLNMYEDMTIEYGFSVHSEQMRRTCIFHALNHILRRENLISHNNEIHNALEGIEGSGHKQLDLKDFQDENEEDNEEEKDEPEEVEEPVNPEEEKVEAWDMVKKVSVSESQSKYAESLTKAKNNDEKYELIKDQGFTKPKVLILAPFKEQAYELVTEIVLQFRQKWKGVAKKKKFKEEYGNKDDFGNDCFRIGIAFYGNNIKLFAPFSKADIIIGKLI